MVSSFFDLGLDLVIKIFPVERRNENIGIVQIEAMACGTPVIAFDRGSMRELIDDRATGRLALDEDAAVAAVHEVGTFDRGASAWEVRVNFGDGNRVFMFPTHPGFSSGDWVRLDSGRLKRM